MGLKEILLQLGEYTGEPCITLLSDSELCAENCRSIKACDENLVVLCMKGQDVRVVGTSLTLENFGAYGVKITGSIHSLTIERHGDQ
jgi:hypothetical protein